MRRGRLIRGSSVVVALGALLILALPIGAAGQSASPAEKVVFVEGTTADVTWVNPLRAISSAEYAILEMNYDLLLNFDEKTLAAAPGIADEWSVSDDGLTWTFHIRDGLTWQDGQPLTANDVAFTYKFIVENDIGTLSSYFPFSTGDSFNAPDESTFIWTTSRPTTAPEYPSWVYVLPQHVWGDFTAKEANKFENFPVIGSGPMQMTEWDKGQSWSLIANENYWNGAPKIDEYIVKFYSNTQAMVEALKNGELDYISGTTPDLFDSLKSVEGITTHVGVPPGFNNLIMNTRGNYPGDGGPEGTGHPALLDERVRLAIAMSIDKQDLVDRVLRGYGVPGTTIVPPRSDFWQWDPPPEEAITYDVAGANAILDEAGYLDTDSDGVREMPGGGQPLDMRLDIENEDPNRIRTGRFIVSYLQQIGIRAKAQAATYNRTISFWLDNDFDLYMWGWGPDPDPDFILSTFTTGQCLSWSDTCYSNETYDQLYSDQQAATDLSERQAIIYEMQKIIYEENPEVVLYYDNSLEAYRSDRWTGLTPSPQPDGYLLNQYTPYSILTLRPLRAGQATAASGGISAGVWIGVLAAIVVIIGIVAVTRRRMASDEDRA